MDHSYAQARATRPELQYRYRTRAAIVMKAVRRWSQHRNVRLLEVGAADGRTLVEFARDLAPGEFVGIEYDAELCAHHVPLPPNASLLQGNATKLPPSLGNSHFTVVSMLAILEHLTDPSAALTEVHRILEPGGLIVATCPNPWWDALAMRSGLMHADCHVQQINAAELIRLVEAAGFHILESRPFMWAPVAFLPYMRLPIPPALGLAVDVVAGRLPLVRRLCVNAFVVGRKQDRAAGR